MYARDIIKAVLIVAAVSMSLASCSRSSRKFELFKNEARQYTESSCPNLYPDGITTLDSVVFDDSDEVGTEFLYYSLTLDSAQREKVLEIESKIYDDNLRFLRNSVIFARQMEEGVRFKFVYYDAAKKDKIIECSYTKEDYQ